MKGKIKRLESVRDICVGDIVERNILIAPEFYLVTNVNKNHITFLGKAKSSGLIFFEEYKLSELGIKNGRIVLPLKVVEIDYFSENDVQYNDLDKKLKHVGL